MKNKPMVLGLKVAGIPRLLSRGNPTNAKSVVEKWFVFYD
ncbi:hypothetical protein JOC94_000119 [Bacillus thermophilus]|uniref:Uncharacterized protein n=1 Tax=Siminovitchia thermophila TaxID=1245522 RepID=A0ABS2R0I7_9BACI|nr:hypothetical protein [Siminovitchia thermophila]